MPSPVPVPTKIRFGTFELDVTAGEVRKGGITLKLQPQPFRVLLLLIERAGQVVTREEIQRVLWTDSTFVDFEHGINFSINQIRRALADNAEKPRYVETLPKRGYRFIGIVEKAPITKPSGSAEDVPDARKVLAYPLRSVVENLEPSSQPTSREKSLQGAVARLVSAAVIVFSSLGLGMHLWKSRKDSPNLDKMHIVRLTESGNAEDVAISPSGEYVVYVLREGERRSLNLRQVVTGRDIQILPPATVELWGLTFSPDGNYVFFLRSTPENFSVDYLYQMPVLGGTPRELIRDIDTPVSFSPEGRQFAFVRIGPSPGTNLLIANADGSGERVLARRPMISRDLPAWSPDGKTIVFAGLDVPGESHLWAVSPLDGSIHSIFTTQAFVGQVRWLPDGQGLLAVISDPVDAHGQLWYISYPAGEAKRVTNDLTDYTSLDLTRDGKSLVTIEKTISSDLWVASGDDFTRVRQITSGRTGVRSVSAGPGRTIVFANQKGDLCSIRDDGSSLALLTPNMHSNGNPSVCKDGRYIVFESYVEGERDIWRMDPDGSHLTQLTKTGIAASPLCSPGSQLVQYSSISGDKNWRVPIGGGTPTQVNINDLAAVPAGYSPDGKLVAYDDYGPGGDVPNRIAVIPEAGGEPIYRFPLRGDANFQRLRWTPNGDGLDYFLTNKSVGNIWRQPIPKGPPRQITNFTSGQIFSFDWSSDHKDLYLARGSVLSDIVLINNFR